MNHLTICELVLHRSDHWEAHISMIGKIYLCNLACRQVAKIQYSLSVDWSWIAPICTFVSNVVYDIAWSLRLITSEIVSTMKEYQSGRSMYMQSVSVTLPLSTRYQHPWHTEDSNSSSTWGTAEYHYRRQARAHCCIPDRWWAHSWWSTTQQNPGRCPWTELRTWGLYIQSCTGRWCGL